ncbi:hypothetical protein L4D20_12420 [Vibrio kyushuensis]|uniref:hypothetical protein n=1 Tax=Vibrio kyushuensis TaxID=2910249 RepID=UPI003D0D8356
MWNNIKPQVLSVVNEIGRVYWALLRILVPATIVVKFLEEIGATTWLASAISPVMGIVGLSDGMGLVWAVAILTNIYTAMVVFYNLALTDTVTVAQATILGSMILIAHGIPVEGAVAKAIGFGWRLTLLVRVGGAIFYGFVLHQIYTLTGAGSEAINLVWQPEISASPSLLEWGILQVTLFLSILGIISALIILLRLLRWIGVEALMHRLLSPLLRTLTIGKEAANITIVGMTLGLTFGAGLLIDEVKKGHINKRDTILVVGFLSLCHSIIEDTFLILLLGADLWGILWGRALFAIIVIAVWGRLMKSNSNLAAESR